MPGKRLKLLSVATGFYLVLFLFTTFTLLYEFVIPHGGIHVDDPTTTTTITTSTTTTSSTTTTDPDDTGTYTTGETTTTEEGTTTTTTITTTVLAYPDELASILESATLLGSHETDSLLINIYQFRQYSSEIYVADVVVDDPRLILNAFANDTFGGKNIVQTVSSMATAHEAIFAINSDYASHYDSGLVIRNGVILRSTYSDRSAIALMSDGSLVSFAERSTSADAMLAAGAWQLWSFGPVLIKDGVSVASVNDGLDRDAVNNPRSAMGMVSPNHFMFVCVDGRTSASSGVDIEELAAIMQELGCVQAYNFDGGGSATMWFDGNVINIPSEGTERKVGDCVYIRP